MIRTRDGHTMIAIGDRNLCTGERLISEKDVAAACDGTCVGTHGPRQERIFELEQKVDLLRAQLAVLEDVEEQRVLAVEMRDKYVEDSSRLRLKLSATQRAYECCFADLRQAESDRAGEVARLTVERDAAQAEVERLKRKLCDFDKLPKLCGWPGCDVLHPNGVSWDKSLDGWMCAKHEHQVCERDAMARVVEAAREVHRYDFTMVCESCSHLYGDAISAAGELGDALGALDSPQPDQPAPAEPAAEPSEVDVCHMPEKNGPEWAKAVRRNPTYFLDALDEAIGVLGPKDAFGWMRKAVKDLASTAPAEVDGALVCHQPDCPIRQEEP